MTGRVSAPVLVGRGPELARLRSAYDGMAGAAVLVQGEAGIGKTRLLEEFAGWARERGARVLAGGCLPFAEAVPYAPVVAMLDELRRVAGDPPSGEDRSRYFDWVASGLLRLAGDGPVLVLVEDLHWADESTVDLVLYLAQAVGGGPVLLLGSRRGDEPGPRADDRLAELVRSGRAELIELEPLGPGDLTALIGGIIGFEPPPGLLRSVLARADGNPFFAEELVAAGAGDELPATVREVVMERVAQLRPETQRLLRVAAAVGRRVDHWLLGRIAELPPDQLDRAVRDAIDQRLLTATIDGYAFRHALGHEAVYRDLLPGEALKLHERIAAALRDHTGAGDPAVTAAEIARHWYAADRPAEALAASCLAAQTAEAGHAPAEALTHYRRALELWRQVPDAADRAASGRAQLLFRAAGAAAASGRYDQAVLLARELLAGLDPDQDPELHAAALEREAWYLRYGGQFDAARDAFTALRDRGATAGSLCGMAGQAFVDGQYLRAIEFASEALALARGAPMEEAAATALLGASRNLVGCHDDGLRLLRTALDLARETDDADRLADNWHYLIDALVLAGRSVAAVPEAEAASARVRELGLVTSWLPKMAAEHTRALLALGRWDDADQVSAAAMSDDNEPFFALRLLFARSLLLIRRGRFAEATDIGDQIEKILGDNLNPWSLGHLACDRAEIAVWQGDLDLARVAVERGMRIVADTDEIRIGLDLAALAARIETDTGGDPDPAVRYAEEFLARVERGAGCRSAEYRLTLDLVRAERTRLAAPAAVEPWTELGERAGSDAWLTAYASWRAAAALRQGGHPGSAEAARTADRLAAALGAQPLRAAIGATATRRFDLTERELEVLRLLAGGLSNSEIGTALGISRKTVSVHVTHILRKLEVNSRVQAAGIAHTLGLT